MLEITKPNTYFASCPRECEELLLNEILSLGISEVEKAKGGVQFTANVEEAFHVLINTRLASRVFLQLLTFNFKNDKQISTKTFAYNWSELFSVHQTFKITAIFDRDAKSHFPNSLYLSQLMKDGIVDHFNQMIGKRPSVDTRNADFNFSLRIEKSNTPQMWDAIISLDLAGFALSNRGYRVTGHSAPLRENLAAAIVSSMDFNPEEEVFIDSMSGSGTLLIEGMLKFLNISPSFLWLKKSLNDLAIFKIKEVKENGELKSNLQSAAKELIKDNELAIKQLRPNTFFAFDISPRYLDILKKTVGKTGLDWKKIRIVKKDATELSPPYEDAKGIIVCNPPYGKRLGEVDELGKLYYDYGENLKKNFKGHRAYVFTSNPELRKKISLQTSQRIPFYNGDIECRLLRYNLY